MFSKLPITKIKIKLAGILYRLLAPFLGTSPRVIERGGIRFSVDLAEGIDFSLFIFGGFQGYLTRSPFLKIPETAVVFDVGGNFGVMALQFAKIASRGKVIAFEPTHYALAKFKKNLELNPLLASRVQLENVFVSSQSLVKPEIQAYSSWRLDSTADSGERHPVHMGAIKSVEGVGSVTLDEYCAKNRIERLDLIKIDTDGHEHEVLQGAEKCVRQFRPKIIFEIGHYVMREHGIGFSFYRDYFSGMNYELIDLKSGNRIRDLRDEKNIPQFGTTDILAVPR